MFSELWSGQDSTLKFTKDLQAAAMMMSTNYFQFWEANFAKDQRGPF